MARSRSCLRDPSSTNSAQVEESRSRSVRLSPHTSSESFSSSSSRCSLDSSSAASSSASPSLASSPSRATSPSLSPPLTTSGARRFRNTANPYSNRNRVCLLHCVRGDQAADSGGAPREGRLECCCSVRVRPCELQRRRSGRLASQRVRLLSSSSSPRSAAAFPSGEATCFSADSPRRRGNQRRRESEVRAAESEAGEAHEADETVAAGATQRKGGRGRGRRLERDRERESHGSRTGAGVETTGTAVSALSPGAPSVEDRRQNEPRALRRAQEGPCRSSKRPPNSGAAPACREERREEETRGGRGNAGDRARLPRRGRRLRVGQLEHNEEEEADVKRGRSNGSGAVRLSGADGERSVEKRQGKELASRAGAGANTEKRVSGGSDEVTEEAEETGRESEGGGRRARGCGAAAGGPERDAQARRGVAAVQSPEAKATARGDEERRRKRSKEEMESQPHARGEKADATAPQRKRKAGGDASLAVRHVSGAADSLAPDKANEKELWGRPLRQRGAHEAVDLASCQHISASRELTERQRTLARRNLQSGEEILEETQSAEAGKDDVVAQRDAHESCSLARSHAGEKNRRRHLLRPSLYYPGLSSSSSQDEEDDDARFSLGGPERAEGLGRPSLARRDGRQKTRGRSASHVADPLPSLFASPVIRVYAAACRRGDEAASISRPVRRLLARRVRASRQACLSRFLLEEISTFRRSFSLDLNALLARSRSQGGRELGAERRRRLLSPSEEAVVSSLRVWSPGRLPAPRHPLQRHAEFAPRMCVGTRGGKVVSLHLMPTSACAVRRGESVEGSGDSDDAEEDNGALSEADHMAPGTRASAEGVASCSCRRVRAGVRVTTKISTLAVHESEVTALRFLECASPSAFSSVAPHLPSPVSSSEAPPSSPAAEACDAASLPSSSARSFLPLRRHLIDRGDSSPADPPASPSSLFLASACAGGLCRISDLTTEALGIASVQHDAPLTAMAAGVSSVSLPPSTSPVLYLGDTQGRVLVWDCRARTSRLPAVSQEIYSCASTSSADTSGRFTLFCLPREGVFFKTHDPLVRQSSKRRTFSNVSVCPQRSEEPVCRWWSSEFSSFSAGAPTVFVGGERTSSLLSRREECLQGARRIEDISVHPENAYIIAATCRDRSVAVWDLRRGFDVAEPAVRIGPFPRVRSASFSPSGHRLLCSSATHQFLFVENMWISPGPWLDFSAFDVTDASLLGCQFDVDTQPLLSRASAPVEFGGLPSSPGRSQHLRSTETSQFSQPQSSFSRLSSSLLSPPCWPSSRDASNAANKEAERVCACAAGRTDAKGTNGSDSGVAVYALDESSRRVHRVELYSPEKIAFAEFVPFYSKSKDRLLACVRRS
ncbi:hypothetical protein BESB_007220 [Besnoitia besnoiti]|uniref:WD domain, G-beta repeat-containing protein n=1 Tax=Besnoitia besnoiti TaxID=94643 RepID=A0A2A9MP33_BESBE|nr:hypothetical protein BESB_007220 [Besnoitia besnoiti]PFH38381.1 hypothetical protein BESB_007220 [Besnoitia besnoiti]